MSTTLLEAITVRLDHTWSKDQPGHRCPNEGYCQTCDGGLDMCTTCGCDNQGGATTECPGERVGHLVTQFVYHSGVDFIDGQWVAPQPDERIERAASMDRYIAYADQRCEKARQQIARGDWAFRTKMLSIIVRLVVPHP